MGPLRLGLASPCPRVAAWVVLCVGLGAPSWPAHADGMYFPEPDSEVTSDRQIGIIAHDGATEELHLLVRFSGTASSFAWIVPLPAEPVVAAGDIQLFVDLAYITEPPEGSGGTCLGCAASGDVAAQEVTLLSQGTVGALDFRVVHADTDAAALATYAAAEGFQVPAAAPAVLDGYIARGWKTFMVARVSEAGTPNSGVVEGLLQPVKLTFSTPAPVFPLEVSKVGAGDLVEVVLYVVGDHRMQATSTTEAEWGWTRYAKHIGEAELKVLQEDRPAFLAFVGQRPWLTKLIRDYWDDEVALLADVELSPAPADEEVLSDGYFDGRDWAAMPAAFGVHLVFFGLVLAFLGLRARRLRRRALEP